MPQTSVSWAVALVRNQGAGSGQPSSRGDSANPGPGGRPRLRRMRQPPSEYHTRLGWWVMTHGRAGPAFVGTCASIVLVADLLLAATHWTGSFPRAFVTSLVALAAVALIAFALRSISVTRASRSATRSTQRAINTVVLVAIVSFIALGRVSGGESGWILGAIAGLSGVFVVYTAGLLIRGRREHAVSGPDSLM